MYDDLPPPARAGIRAIAPLIVAAFPFGLVYGVAVTRTDIDPWLGAAASVLILAGAAQLSLLELLDATWAVAVGTSLVINLRFLLYSAALAPSFGEFPTPWRLGLPYLMTDQAATTSLNRFPTVPDPGWRRRFYLASAIAFASAWWLGTGVGIAFGADIPASWQVGFALPLMFIALLVPPVRTRPAVMAAAVGGLVTLMAGDLPSGLDICLGSVAGIAAGTWAALRNEAVES